MRKLRVLVVEDSLTVRRRLCDALTSDPGIEVVGEAQDGAQAIERCERLRPDVITLDMMLPVMTGVRATEHIMANFPTPILIVSGSTNRGELFHTYEALAAGAIDVLEKPGSCDLDDAAWDRKLTSAVKLVARIPVIRHPRARLADLGRRPTRAFAGAISTAPPIAPAPSSDDCRVVALGASTGGPSAVLAVLRALPASLPVPILLVLHIGQPFDTAFAEWLGGQIPHPVCYARDGESLSTVSGVRMAPGGMHLAVRAGRLRLTSEPERNSCRPSVDVLFESLAAECGSHVAACLLTGMGRDGATGLLAIERAGGVTIAQDEATSVVYGMPREAILLGAAQRILPIDAIGPALATLFGVRKACAQ